MNLEFRIYQLKDESCHWLHLKKYNDNNKFIIVGEENKHKEILAVLKVHQLDKNHDLKLFPGCKLDEMTLLLEQDQLIPTNKYVEFDIPKKAVTLEMIEEIQRLNQVEEIPIAELLPELEKVDFNKLI